MSTSIYVVGPGGGSVSTAPTIAAALAAARTSGGTVFLVAGTYTEDLSLQDGDRLVAAGPGVVVRGEHVISLSTSSGAVELVGLVLEHYGTSGLPTLGISGSSPSGSVTLRGCAVRVPSGDGTIVPLESLSDALLEVIDTAIAADPTTAGAPAVSNIGGGSLVIRSGSIVSDASYAAISHTCDSSNEAYIRDTDIVGFVAFDDAAASLPTGYVVASLGNNVIRTGSGQAAIQSTAGASSPTHFVELDAGNLIDAGSGYAVSGLVVRQIGDVSLPESGARLAQTGKPVGSFVARARKTLVYGTHGTAIPGSNSISMSDLADVVVIETAGSQVTLGLNPAADVPDGHQVLVVNAGSSNDVVVAAGSLNWSSSTTIHVNAGEQRVFVADAASGSWIG